MMPDLAAGLTALPLGAWVLSMFWFTALDTVFTMHAALSEVPRLAGREMSSRRWRTPWTTARPDRPSSGGSVALSPRAG